MKIVVGLGNPGSKYETTRHNVGFLAVDRLIDAWKASGPVEKYGGEIYQVSRGGEKVLLVKPQTFMNVSGRCVGPLVTFYKCAPGDLLVIHDDIDLPALALRIKTGGGTGGHNGLKSIDENLGAGQNGYHRIRIGIGRGTCQAVDYVLQQFSDDELSALDQVLDSVAFAVDQILKGDVSGAMNKFNKRDK